MSTGGLDRPDGSPCSNRRKMGVNLRSRDPNVISPRRRHFGVGFCIGRDVSRQDECPRILLSCYRARNSRPEITSPALELALKCCFQINNRRNRPDGSPCMSRIASILLLLTLILQPWRGRGGRLEDREGGSSRPPPSTSTASSTYREEGQVTDCVGLA